MDATMDATMDTWITPAPMSFTCLAPLLYCFGTVFNSLNIYNTLRFKTPARGLTVTNYSVAAAAALYALFAFAGFAAYLPPGSSAKRDGGDGDHEMYLNVFGVKREDGET